MKKVLCKENFHFFSDIYFQKGKYYIMVEDSSESCLVRNENNEQPYFRFYYIDYFQGVSSSLPIFERCRKKKIEQFKDISEVIEKTKKEILSGKLPTDEELLRLQFINEQVNKLKKELEIKQDRLLDSIIKQMMNETTLNDEIIDRYRKDEERKEKLRIRTEKLKKINGSL